MRMLIITIMVFWILTTPAWADRLEGDPITIGSGNLYLGDSDTDGTLRWYDDDGEYFEIDAADMAGNFAYVWPADDGDASQFLQTDGGGTLDWATVTSPEAGTAAGQMLYWDHGNTEWKHTETTELYWDDTDKELGVGIATPTAPLHVFDATNEDLVFLEYEGADASGATVEFFHDSASPADSDKLGEIIYWGRDSLGNSDQYAQIIAYSDDVTSGTEDGGLAIETKVDGTYRSLFDIFATEVRINNAGVDVDFTVEGENDVNLISTDAANDRVGFSTGSPQAMVDIDGDTTTTKPTLEVTRDLAAASTDSAVVSIVQGNAGDDQSALTISNYGTGKALTALSTLTGEAISASSTGGDGILAATLAAGNGIYSLKCNQRIKCGTWADFDELSAAASPPCAPPPAGDGRLYCVATENVFSFIDDAGMAYGYSDQDKDTKIQVEEGDDDDTFRVDCGGSEEFTLTASAANFNGTVECDTKYVIDGNDGIDAASITVITDVDFNTMTIKYRTMTWEGGILISDSGESGWTPAPLNP